MRWFAPLAAFAAVLCVAAFSTSAHSQNKSKPKVGDAAPEVESVDEQGKPWKSSDVVGKKVLVLYFYPADFTGGCTKQACGFRDDIEALNGKGVEVVGVSGDSAKTHALFKKHHKLNFTLLADEKGEVASAFGVPTGKGGVVKHKTDDGSTLELVRGTTIQRWTVVVGKDGKILALDSVKDAGGDAKRIAQLIEKAK